MKQPSLRELRRLAGWTLIRTARVAGIGQSALSEIETGGRRVAPKTEKKIRRVLLRAAARRGQQLGAVLAASAQVEKSVEA